MQDKPVVFVVVDPNDDRHVALERALTTARERNPQPKLAVFVAVDGEAVDTRAVNDHLFRDEFWFRDQIRKKIITDSLIQEFVGSRITLLSSEIEKYYKDHASDFTKPEEVELSEIEIHSNSGPSEAEAVANEVRKKLTGGEPFATLASQYSRRPGCST